MRNYLRVDSLCRPVGKAENRWGKNVVLRIAKREALGWRRVRTSHASYKYFVVALGDAAGYGSWCNFNEVRALSPLELLAMEAV